jgi:hypothetical protein
MHRTTDDSGPSPQLLAGRKEGSSGNRRMSDNLTLSSKKSLECSWHANICSLFQTLTASPHDSCFIPHAWPGRRPQILSSRVVRKERIMRNITFLALAAVALASGTADAGVVMNVFARANSSTGGTGLDTGVSLSSGQSFTVSAAPTDLWSAGALPRWSNADGLTTPLAATGSDESGESAGTTIGEPFPLHTQNGLTAPFGSLVGEVNDVFFLIGTSFSGTAPGTGTDILTLYYWDSNFADNAGSIAATIDVPEPGAVLLVALGLFGIAATHRRRLVPSS